MIKKKIYKDKDTQTQTKTNMMCFQDPMHAIFLKSRGFKDIKYGICSQIFHQQMPTTNFPQKLVHPLFFPPKLIFHLSTHSLNI